MAEYIYEIKNNLHPDVCKHIIEKFEQDNKKHDGKIGGNDPKGYVVKSIKDSTDLKIFANCEYWKDVDHYLFHRLSEGYNLYQKHVKNFMKKSAENFPNNSSDITLLDNVILAQNDTGYQIQRVDKNGFYKWHSDYALKRQVAYIWYLNTLNPENDGGTTDFLTYNKKIVPEEGKLIFFPSIWTYPHSGSKVISDNSKYIITGFMMHD